MANEQSVFRFDLNESLYFERGQEVAEIMGISLDPEISIQEFNDYISIRGVVELQGSYQKEPLVGEETEDDAYLDGYDSKRYMERVTDNHYGGAEFMHRFPIEITVPSYRVDNVDDVLVTISEFDYELPESNHLCLRSTIEIYGINNEVEEETTEEAFESQTLSSNEEEVFTRDTEDTFEFEVKHDVESSSSSSSAESPEHYPNITEDVQKDEVESDRWKFKEKTQSFDEFFQKNKEPEEVEEVEEVEVESVESSSYYMDDEADGSPIESDESRTQRADLTYLADMFRGGDEQYAKLRLCIVQEKDTLESLAEKYQTSTLLIRNQNQLEDDDLSEGQIIYIPVK
ncbi:stage VI sporulation protein D [Ornithinibacillus xuwenensis]|uniref:Stage VI sporulation protein D n=1 Tax=Ornithinibacillus xuwenensis TaxID=3144668 RepID=A0ABU9XBT5_9BACI